ncbi:hypothetical protein Tco_1464978 [Tanacetum coccineum]
MDDPDMTMEEYVRYKPEKALRNNQVYNWETAKYGKINYIGDINYLIFFETKFPAIVYDDALSSQHIDKANWKNKTSLFEHDDEKYNIISKRKALKKRFSKKEKFNILSIDEDLFSYDIFSVNYLKLDKDNDEDKIGFNMANPPQWIRRIHHNGYGVSIVLEVLNKNKESGGYTVSHEVGLILRHKDTVASFAAQQLRQWQHPFMASLRALARLMMQPGVEGLRGPGTNQRTRVASLYSVCDAPTASKRFAVGATRSEEDSDKIEAGTTSTNLTAKLPILNPWDYDLRLMRIEQYFLITDYSFWEVIKNGNKVLNRTVGETEQEYEPTIAEEKQDRRNEIKARGTLLMALLNKDQLKFYSYKDAKLFMEATEKRYGGNKESKKVQRTLLNQQYENFLGSSSEIYQLAFLAMDDLNEPVPQNDSDLQPYSSTLPETFGYVPQLAENTFYQQHMVQAKYCDIYYVPQWIGEYLAGNGLSNMQGQIPYDGTRIGCISFTEEPFLSMYNHQAVPRDVNPYIMEYSDDDIYIVDASDDRSLKIEKQEPNKGLNNAAQPETNMSTSTSGSGTKSGKKRVKYPDTDRELSQNRLRCQPTSNHLQYREGYGHNLVHENTTTGPLDDIPGKLLKGNPTAATKLLESKGLFMTTSPLN